MQRFVIKATHGIGHTIHEVWTDEKLAKERQDSLTKSGYVVEFKAEDLPAGSHSPTVEVSAAPK